MRVARRRAGTFCILMAAVARPCALNVRVGIDALRGSPYTSQPFRLPILSQHPARLAIRKVRGTTYYFWRKHAVPATVRCQWRLLPRRAGVLSETCHEDLHGPPGGSRSLRQPCCRCAIVGRGDATRFRIELAPRRLGRDEGPRFPGGPPNPRRRRHRLDPGRSSFVQACA